MDGLSFAVYKIMAFIISVIMTTGSVVTPGTGAALAASKSNVLTTFVAVGDTQICNYNPERTEYLIGASEDFKNSNGAVDTLVIAGDVTENGFESEYKFLYDYVSVAGFKNYILAAGNHDIRLRNYNQSRNDFLKFMNSLNSAENAQSKLYYSYKVNGARFIVIASDETRFEDAHISDEQLAWLENELSEADADGEVSFVISHYPFNDTHGLPDTWSNSLWESGGLGKQSDAVKNVLGNHKNVFYISGHLHTGFGQYTYETIGNIHSVNLPSLGIENKDGTYNNQGAGLFVEVYENEVIFRARNFATGEYLPDYNLTVPITK